MEYKPSFVDQLDVDYICHHGIKGMHWGVRRFQNEDGSYTSAGRKRYFTNPVKKFKEQYEHNKAQASVNKQFERINNIAVGLGTEATRTEAKYADSRKESIFDDALDDYDLEPTTANFNKAIKLGRDYAYDYGKKAGQELVNKHGTEAVNRYIDIKTHSGSAAKAIPDQDIFKVMDSLKSQNAADRYAQYCANRMTDWAEGYMYESRV